MPRGVFQDHTGCVYGRLTVVRHLGYGRWLCRCSCGNEVVRRGSLLDKGKATSCGCITREKNQSRQSSTERLYHVWQSMKSRCFNKNNKSYSRYGGRGIRVCDQWKNDYAAFKAWAIESGYMPNAMQGECTLDRIDVDGNYEPDNCRWVSVNVQNINKSHPKNMPSLWKPIEMLDDSGNVIARFASQKDASKTTGVSASSISAVCNGRMDNVKGLVFRFMDVTSIEKQMRYGTDEDYHKLSLSIAGFGTIINSDIVYPDTNISVRIGDLVMFPSMDNYPMIDTGAVIGVGYGGWKELNSDCQTNITISVTMLDGTVTAVPINEVTRK